MCSTFALIWNCYVTACVRFSLCVYKACSAVSGFEFNYLGVRCGCHTAGTREPLWFGKLRLTKTVNDHRPPKRGGGVVATPCDFSQIAFLGERSLPNGYMYGL